MSTQHIRPIFILTKFYMEFNTLIKMFFTKPLKKNLVYNILRLQRLLASNILNLSLFLSY